MIIGIANFPKMRPESEQKKNKYYMLSTFARSLAAPTAKTCPLGSPNLDGHLFTARL